MENWADLQKVKMEAVRREDWNEVKMITLKCADIWDKMGKNSFKLRQEAAKYELYEYKDVCKDLGYLLEISSLPDCCEFCKENSEKVYEYEDALGRMPIPHKNCSNEIGFCRCMWLPKSTE